MSSHSRIILIIALIITLAAIITWRATGGDYYTKFRVIKQVESAVDHNDPLAQTGFYDDQKQIQTSIVNQFRLGLFPGATGLLDKNIISVASILPPVWIAALLLTRFGRKRRKKA